MRNRRQSKTVSTIVFFHSVYMLTCEKILTFFLFQHSGGYDFTKPKKIAWKVGGNDLLSKFNDFRGYSQSLFSLALDRIADVSPGSEFASTLSHQRGC